MERTSGDRGSDWAQTLAVPLELEVEGPDRLVGRFRGEQVAIERVFGHFRILMALEAPLPPRFLIRRQQGPGLRDERGPDLVVGDPELDPLLQIQSAHPASTIRLLKHPELKARLLETFAACSPVINARKIALELEEDSIESFRRALGVLSRLAGALREAAEHEVRAHEEARLNAKDELVYLPSQRFVKDDQLRYPIGSARRARRWADRLHVTSIAMFFGLVGANWFLHAHEGLLFTGVLVSMTGGQFFLWKGSRCERCGVLTRVFLTPFSQPYDCEHCGFRY